MYAASGDVALVHEIYELLIVEHISCAIRQQPVVGAADEKLVELGSGHEAPDGGAKGGRAALRRGVLRIGGVAPGEDECGAAQGLSGGRHRHGVEQRLRREGDRRDLLGAEQREEALHVLVVHRAGRDRRPAPVRHPLYLVQDVLGAFVVDQVSNA